MPAFCLMWNQNDRNVIVFFTVSLFDANVKLIHIKSKTINLKPVSNKMLCAASSSHGSRIFRRWYDFEIGMSKLRCIFWFMCACVTSNDRQIVFWLFGIWTFLFFYLSASGFHDVIAFSIHIYISYLVGMFLFWNICVHRAILQLQSNDEKRFGLLIWSDAGRC